ncbi:MAG TPA: ABC transporter permease [Candidatus Pelethocola excrementipullorum]|nr:ABC transporter permease [Candidatus Pelethocola excrementipullorum]
MLFRKILRDFKDHGTQFLSIFLMLGLGIFIYAGMNAVGVGMKKSADEYYKTCNLADAFLYGETFTKEEEEELINNNLVDQAVRRLQLSGNLIDDKDVVLDLYFTQSDEVSQNVIMEGEKFQGGDGIWLDELFAKAHNYKIGDEIKLQVQGIQIKENIKGLIMNPEYVYSAGAESPITDHKSFGYAYLPAKSFPLYPDLPYNQMVLTSTMNKQQLEDRMNEVRKDKTTMLIMRKDHPSVSAFENELGQMKAVETAFPIIFLLIAILTMITTMIRITTNQRVQIETLKAVGFSKFKIISHYMTYGTILSILGCVFGLLTGPKFLPWIMFSFQKEFYTLPEWKAVLSGNVWITIAFCVLACVGSCYLAVRKELKGAAAEILRPKAPRASKHFLLEGMSWWKKSSFQVQWNIRDIIRNKLRTMITVLGIAGCMMLVLCAFGLKDTINSMIKTMYTDFMRYETKVIFEEALSREELETLREDGKLQFLGEYPAEVKSKDSVKSSMLNVVGEGEFLQFRDSKNREIELPEEGIAITRKMAETLNLSLNDTVSIKNYKSKEWVEYRIEQVVVLPLSQGFYISQKAYEKAGQDFAETAFLSGEGKSYYEKSEKYIVQSRKDVKENLDKSMESMNVVILILILGAVILGVVVLYNLGILSYTEKARELATLKVLGFPKSKLRKLQLMQNTWITLAGVLVGVPLGYELILMILKEMGDMLDLVVTFSLSSYLISGGGTFVVSLVISRLMNKKLDHLDMVSALKSIE